MLLLLGAVIKHVCSSEDGPFMQMGLCQSVLKTVGSLQTILGTKRTYVSDLQHYQYTGQQSAAKTYLFTN